ncbi:chromo (CHRromatin organization MOdifier) domain-containing protein [Sarocladium implicatum]|nr:chromo (CHRromatin organization MOdifier) domain-containing protein [Sarocladium implicatum]
MASHTTRDSRPAQTTKSTPRLVVELRSRPALYAPGSGPPLLPVTLLPPKDSTAFIVDRILLASPGLAKDGKPLPRRMTYIVGWHDLPAARNLVPAMKILDYVSPWALEDWEYNFEEELEQERNTLLDEKAKEKAAQALATKSAPTGSGKKRRGRPPTHKHTQIKAGAVAVAETEEDGARARLKAGTMSLSTPKKMRMADFDGLSGAEGSPSRQSRRGFASDVEMMDVEKAITEAVSRDEAQPLERSVPGLLDDEVIPAQIPSLKPAPLSLKPRTSAQYEQRTLPNMFNAWAARGGVSSAASYTSSRAPIPSSVQALPPLRPSHTVPPGRAPSYNPLNSQTMESRPASSSSLPAPATDLLEQPPVPSAPESSTTPRPKSSDRPKADVTTSKPHRKTKKKKPPLLDENGVPVWTVKRIEDEAVFEIEGQGLKTLYKVRWEGDWPPEENPTWEPAENLPKSLLRNWLKVGPREKERLAKGLKRKPSSSGKRPLSANGKAAGGKRKQARLDRTSGVGKKFTSVSDVFEHAAAEERDTNDLDMGVQRNGREPPVAEDNDDELLLVEEVTGAKKGKEDGKASEIPKDRRTSFAAAVMSSSWGAFFGNR